MPIDRNGGQYITANPQQPTQSSAPGIWDIDEQGSAQAAGRWPLPPNVVQRSLRFNSADSAYLSRTPAAAGNRQTWTYSVWIKRGKLGSAYELFTSGTNVVTGPAGQITLRTSDDLRFVSGDGSTLQADLITTQVFRDPSAWYHLVFAVDTTQATSSNRIKIYVNGTQITAFGTATYPSQNANLTWNQAQLQGLFTNVTATNGSSYFDGYGAEINFVDGQALTPSSFGQTDAQTGQWIPRVYSGSYGTNGFRLQFLDNSGTTATTLGKDTSGLGNNWTPNNFSVAAGSGNDSLRDVPMNYYSPDNGLGGEVIGNYATFNPLSNPGNSTLTNGNLDVSTPNATAGRVLSTLGPSSGRWYCEFTVTNVGAGFRTGIVLNGFNDGDIIGKYANEYAYASDGNKYSNSVSASYGATYTTGDIIGVALDLESATTSLTFYKNGVSQGVAYTGMSGIFMFGVCDITGASGISSTANFGQRPFAYTAPSGFKALCTQNLSAPRIGNVAVAQADDFFNAVVYTGNGNTSPGQLVTTGFQPDLVWIKERSSTEWHQWYDALRSTNALFSNTTDAELPLDGVTLQSNGFYAKDNARTNQNTEPYVGWCWNAGGSTVTNTSGSITSSVRANQTSGFSILTTNGSAGPATIGHGLGAVPSFIIGKDRDTSATNWVVYHSSLGAGSFLTFTNGGTNTDPGVWGGTTPTSSVFTVGSYISGSFVWYAFAAVPGFSAFGSYTGNGSADGTFVYLGFRPRFVLIKSTSATTEWVTMDTSRSPYNLAEAALYANRDYSEATIGAVNDIDFLSNGFKLRNTTGFVNAAQTYIYAAFAEIPFQFANAR